MLFVIGMCIGVVIGGLLILHTLKRWAVGNLVIVSDEDESPYIFLEIKKTDAEVLRTQTVIKLNVVDRSKIPHK